MRALTVYQPWADAIMWRGKCVENRTWSPPAGIEDERIAIHAAWSERSDKELEELEWIAKRSTGVAVQSNRMSLLCGIPRGCVVGTCRVVAVVRTRADTGDAIVQKLRPDAEIPHPTLWMPWWAGDIGWILGDVVPIQPPIPTRGAQRVWKLPGHIERRLVERHHSAVRRK